MISKHVLLYGTGAVVTTVLGLVLLTGCGGGSGVGASSASGRAVLTITWPTSTTAATSKLVPVASSSIVVSFSQNGTVVATQTVARPTTGTTSTLTFATLPAGTLTATATAYPNTDGTGTAQASANVAVTITAGQSTAVNLTMASTIDHLALTPTTPSVAVGATTALTATAYDASGSVVLTSASEITWASATPSVATVDSSGVVTGVAAGTASITATETESGKTTTTVATVTTTPTPTLTPTPMPTPAAVSVTITPSSATIGIGLTQAFSATVTNTTNQTVSWTVQEGTTGGKVTSSGIYTAPATAGTYHVVATSAADSTASATATVTVQSGGSTVIVN